MLLDKSMKVLFNWLHIILVAILKKKKVNAATLTLSSWQKNRLCLSCRNTKIDIFHFHVFIQSVSRSLPAYPGLLNSTKRGSSKGNPSLVHAHHTPFKRFSNPPAAMHITTIKIGC